MKENKNIFTIVTFGNLKEYTIDGQKITKRCSSLVGFLHAKQEAIDCVVNNVGDIYEDGWYPFALVEEVPEGVYGIDNELFFEERHTWFEWNKEKNKYEIIEKMPKDLEGYCDFSFN